MRKLFKQVTATALSFAMVASLAMVAPVSAVAAEEETAKAEPFWSVDFNNGFEDLGVEGEDYTIAENGVEPEIVTEVIDGTEIKVLQLKQSTGNEIWGKDYKQNDILYGYENNSTITVKNPFASLGEDYFTEYTPYQDIIEENLVEKYNGKKQPIWTKGATINYWIYVPASETADDQGRTVGVNSSVFTWDLRDYQYQADDLAKYLTCHYFDLEQERLKAENPDAVYNESGVPEGSKYWFEWKKDENGDPIIVEDAIGNKGPLYGTSGDKARFGEHFWMNPNYIQGFTGTDESNYSFMSYEPNYYNRGFNKLPINEETGELDFSNGSMVRVAATHGAMQIDSNSSMFWNNDNSRGINLNSNNLASYGQRAGMQNGDCFFIHSWQESATNTQTADTALYLADSPYSKPGEWHMVTATLMNDWVEFYLDGEMVDVEGTYSSRGAVSLDSGESFKRFNKGTGMRGGYGSEKNMGDMYYGNYVCRLFLDWLTNPNTTFTIGGICVAEGDAGMYVMAQKTEPIKIAKIDFYSTVLDDAQIAEKFEAGMLASDVLYGDVDMNGTVEAADALETLKAVVKLVDLTDDQVKAADVDGVAGVEAADALEILKYVVKLIDKFPVEG